MGRQFSFFLGPEDQKPFDDVLRASGDIAFLKARSLSCEPEEVQNSVIVEMGKDPLDLLVARRADLPRICFHAIKGRTEFSCNPMIAPIVQFSRCYVDNRFIRAGRLYRTDVFWGTDNERQKKSPEFLAWAERLYRQAKRSLTLVEGSYYAGDDARRMRDLGVAFEGLDIKIGSVAN